MPKVVLDTNVFISAILTRGQPRKVVEMARKGTIELAVSEAILGAIERILRLKLHRADWEIDAILRGIRDISTFVSPGQRLTVITADDADNRVLECAVAAKANYIVSGDTRHLLPLKTFEDISIVSPAGLCKLMEMEPDA